MITLTPWKMNNCGCGKLKPKEWVGIKTKPNCKFAITCVCLLLLKGPTCLPYLFYLVPISFCLTMPCLFYLDLAPLCLALSCLPTLGHACFAYPWMPLVTLHLGQIKYYRSKVITKGATVGVVPFVSESIKHDKVVHVNNNVFPIALKHQIVALLFFPSYLLPLPPTHLFFFFLSPICHWSFLPNPPLDYFLFFYNT